MVKKIRRERIAGFTTICILALSLLLVPLWNSKPAPSLMIESPEGREWVIRWRQKVNPAFLQTVVVIHRSAERDDGETMLVQVKKGLDPELWTKRWAKDPGVEYLHPNHKYKLEGNEHTTGTESFDDFYYLEKIRANQAWKVLRSKQKQYTKLHRPVVVAVIDTGVDFRNPKLAPLLMPGVNLKNRSLPPQDEMGHGSKVAGVVAAVWGAFSKEGPVGNGKILPIKVMEDGTDGDIYFTAEGIREAVRRRADIIVLAQGSWTYSQMMADAVKEAERAGILVVSAAGNASYDINGKVVYNHPLYYPAALPNVLGVGSVSLNGTHELSSNTGEGIDVAAPGEWIKTTGNDGDFHFDSGTSFAAPQAAAVAAMILQLHREYSAADLRHLISQTALKGPGEPRWDERMGFGQLDAYRALTTPLSPDLSEPNNRPELSMPVSTAQELKASLTEKDEDWYHMDVKRAGILLLQFHKKKGEWGDSCLKVTIAENGHSSLYRLDQWQNIRLTVPAGRVHLQIIGPKKPAKEIVYRWQATWIPPADEYENNDYQWNAADIDLFEGLTAYQGTIHKKRDMDWYRLVIPKQGQLEIGVQTFTPRMDPVLYIQTKQDWKGMRVDAGGEGEREQMQMKVEEGSLYLRISDYGGNVIDDFYQLTFHYQADIQDPTEPNQTSNEAATILMGQEMQGQLTEVTDIDWYSFYMEQEQQTEYVLLALDQLKGVNFTLYDAERRVIQTWSGDQERNEAVSLSASVPPGRYLLRVRAENKTGLGAYRIRIQTK
ncbi:S8 family serine peptidase [Paenactinomyces guangxiensis]|uniref:S8 family serine peptidase n=1 Tax=Paenactinomyces guangxiensis TaxID=1490290 RepID=A0A7W1WSP9_9BACL|nr:S8 family serine peptidase [Paenactinomyces guangxiensis]MBA4495372.1 S8 family serine peptidase [Paenactinomyces guangxiensis]MBH8592507.1 S8 family serine peptidase [Paenactinomyces guangxiensis]